MPVAGQLGHRLGCASGQLGEVVASCTSPELRRQPTISDRSWALCWGWVGNGTLSWQLVSVRLTLIVSGSGVLSGACQRSDVLYAAVRCILDANWVQDGLQRRPGVKKVPKTSPKWSPKRSQKGAKRGQKSIKILCKILIKFGLQIGTIWGPKMAPNSIKK